MSFILLVWLTLGVPEPSFHTQFTRKPGLAESEFLREPQDKQDERQWKAGTYRGITVGKSTATELFQKWGKPKDIGHWDWDNPKNPKFRLYHFDSQEGLPGRIMVHVEMKTGKVDFIDVSPDELSFQFVDKPIRFKSAKECETWPECRPKRKSVKRKRS